MAQPFISRPIHIFDAVFATGGCKFGLQVFDVCIDEVVVIHHVGHIAAEMFGHGALRYDPVFVADEKQQQFIFRFGKFHQSVAHGGRLVQ